MTTGAGKVILVSQPDQFASFYLTSLMTHSHQNGTLLNESKSVSWYNQRWLLPVNCCQKHVETKFLQKRRNSFCNLYPFQKIHFKFRPATILSNWRMTNQLNHDINKPPCNFHVSQTSYMKKIYILGSWKQKKKRKTKTFLRISRWVHERQRAEMSH